jgi:hypothetical protein
LKAISRRTANLEKRINPAPDPKSISAADLLRELRNKRLAAQGIAPQPLLALTPSGHCLSIAETLRAIRAQRYAAAAN